MFITNHTIAGGLIGVVLRHHPVAALAVGVASHFALDAVPHWGLDPERVDKDEAYFHAARRDGLLGASLLAGALLLAPKKTAMAAGIFGAVIPDIGHVTRRFWNWDPYSARVNHFHAVIQDESPERLGREVVIGLVGASLLAGALRLSKSPKRA